MKISANQPKSGMFLRLTKISKVGDTMVQFHLQAQVALKVKDDELQEASSLAPFWMAKTTHEMDEAIMAIVEGSKNVPIMKNIVDVAAGDSLIRYTYSGIQWVQPSNGQWAFTGRTQSLLPRLHNRIGTCTSHLLWG